MASRVEFKVSATPIVSVAAGENMAVDTIARDASKILTGSGTVTATFANTLGYTTGTASYLTPTDAGWTTITLTTTKTFVYIRHTGFTSSAFTTTTSSLLRCTVLDENTGYEVEYLAVPAGGAVVLPLGFTGAPSGLRMRLRSSSGNICVEYFVTD